MSNPVYGAPLVTVEGETKSLSTTAGYVAIHPKFHEVKMYCATQWRLALSPALVHAVVYDGTNYTDYLQSVTDRVAATHLPLDGMTTSQKLYLGFSEPALGAYLDLHATNVNAVAATLDVEYCTTAVGLGATIAFTDVTGDSDGTDTGPGTTLAQDGVYTWTLPTDWVKSTLGTYALRQFSECYWVRFTPSTTLSATIDVQEIIPVYKNANYAYMEAAVEYQFSVSPVRCGGFVVVATAGTPTLDISWMRH